MAGAPKPASGAAGQTRQALAQLTDACTALQQALTRLDASGRNIAARLELATKAAQDAGARQAEAEKRLDLASKRAAQQVEEARAAAQTPEHDMSDLIQALEKTQKENHNLSDQQQTIGRTLDGLIAEMETILKSLTKDTGAASGAASTATAPGGSANPGSGANNE